MNLTQEEFSLARKIVEDCLKIDDDKIEYYIKDSLKTFIEKLDKYDFNDRNKIFSFLRQQSIIFMNFDINSGIYLLSDKERNKAIVGMKCVVKIIKDLKVNLL